MVTRVIGLRSENSWLVTQQSQPSQLRQTQAEADGRRGAAGQGLGKDLSKTTAFESLESSLGADAVGCLVL